MKFSLLFSQNLLAKLAFARLNRINLQQGVFKFLLNLILFSFFKLFVSLKCYNCPFNSTNQEVSNGFGFG